MPKKPSFTLKEANTYIAKQEIMIVSLHLNLDSMEQKLRVANSLSRRLSRELKTMQKLATHDALTGLLNERGGSEVISHHLSILHRDSCPKNNFAVLYLDLNDFKRINDEYGHDVGDKALKSFTEKIVGVLRSEYDIVIRMHGDEFVIILPGSSRNQAAMVKNKIKDELARNPFVFRGGKLFLSSSIGIAMALDRRKTVSVKELLEHADKAMFEDKKLSKHP